MAYGGRGPTGKSDDRLFKAILIIAIVGLVLFFVVPWFTVQSEVNGKTEYFHFNYDLKLVHGDEDKYGGDELFGNFGGKIESFTKGSIWLSFWGLLLTLIVVIIFLIIERIGQLIYFFQYYRPLIIIIFCSVLIILSMLVITSGLRMVNIKITELHSNYVSQQLDYEVLSHWYQIAGYIMLILGMILLAIPLMAIKQNIRQLELKHRPPDPRFGDRVQDRPAKRLLSIMLYLTILSLIFIPLFPYFGITQERTKDYDWESGTEEKVEVTDFTIGSPFSIEISSGYGPDSYNNIKDDLGAIGIMSWVALPFLILGFIGLAIYSMNRWRIVYIILFIIVAISLVILSSLILTFHGLMIKDIFELGDDLSDDTEIIFAYNYMPLIFAIIILIFSIFFLIFVIRYSRPVLAEIMSRRPYGCGYGYQPYPPPPTGPGPRGPPMPPGRAMPGEPYHDYRSPSPQVTKEQMYCGEPVKKCPSCGGRLESSPHGEFCTGCGRYF